MCVNTHLQVVSLPQNDLQRHLGRLVRRRRNVLLELLHLRMEHVRPFQDYLSEEVTELGLGYIDAAEGGRV